MNESLQERVENIRSAARERFNPNPQMGPSSIYVRDVFEQYVILQDGEELWQVGYSIAADGAITFDDRDKWQKVELQYVPVTS